MTDSEERRVAVIGAGYWGKNLVRNFHALGALGAIYDQNHAAVEAMLAAYPGPQRAVSVEDVLRRDDIDAVAIGTPAATHGELVRAALMAGKDVFVEKPLCLSTREGAALVALAAAEERVLMVGHLLWYHPAVLELRRLVAEGGLGRVRYIYSNRLNMGKLRQEENVLWSFAPHDVSVILGLLRAEPESVQAHGGHYLNRDIADTTVTMLNFANGVRAHIFVSWLHPFKEQKLVVVGEEKMAVFDDTLPWPEKLQLYGHRVAWHDHVPVAEKGEAQPVALAEAEPLRAECEHFLGCVRERATPRTDGAEGVRVLAVLNASQEALETGRQVALRGAEPEYFVHETAVIDADVAIGPGTKIWHFSHVLSGSRVGAGCSIGQNVVIGPKVRIGDGCRIQNNVSVYDGVELEDDVFCGPSMVFTNVVNPRSHVSRKDEFRPTPVRRGATIGANATVVCGHELGAYCFVGAGAVVTKDVPAHALVVGNPARQVGWMCRCGERLDAELGCPCGRERYEAHGDGIALVAADAERKRA